MVSFDSHFTAAGVGKPKDKDANKDKDKDKKDEDGGLRILSDHEQRIADKVQALGTLLLASEMPVPISRLRTVGEYGCGHSWENPRLPA